MSFNLKFYWCSDDPRKMTKTLIDSGSDSNLIVENNQINFKEGHDLSEFTVTLRNTSNYRPFDRVNYVKVEKITTGIPRPWDMVRYYFVDPPVRQPEGLYTFKCRLDVLMTYADQLKALTVTLDRSETIFNGYLPDSEYSALGYRAITCKAFPKALDNDSYVLMTTG